MTNYKKLRVVLWILVAIALAAMAVLWHNQNNPDKAYTKEINKEEKALQVAFHLTDMNAQPVTEKSWPGKYRIIFFGYGNCPDMCPTGFANDCHGFGPPAKSHSG